MTDKTQPKALQLADDLVSEWASGNVSCETADEAAAELRRQHARIAELEAQIEAVGAGGVQRLSPSKPTGTSANQAQAAINSGVQAAPAGFVTAAAFDRLHAHAEQLAARLLADDPAAPQATSAQDEREAFELSQSINYPSGSLERLDNGEYQCAMTQVAWEAWQARAALAAAPQAAPAVDEQTRKDAGRWRSVEAMVSEVHGGDEFMVIELSARAKPERHLKTILVDKVASLAAQKGTP